MNENAQIEKKIVKRNNRFCVIHCHGKDKGKIIKCFDSYKECLRFHRAIMASKYKDLTNSEVLEYSKFAMINESDNVLIKCFKEISRRKENKELDWNLKIKELAKPIRNRWNRIEIKLSNQETTSIVLKSDDYEKLKEHLSFNLKNKNLPNRLKTLINRIHNFSDEELLEWKKRLDE